MLQSRLRTPGLSHPEAAPLLLTRRLAPLVAAQSQPDRTRSTSDRQNLPSPKRLAACLHRFRAGDDAGQSLFQLGDKGRRYPRHAQSGCLRRDRPHDVRRQGRHRVDAQRLHGERPVQPWRTELCRRCQPRVRRKSGCAGQSAESRYRHLFQPLPAELIDAAFIDRLHGYLPGWEVPKITPQALANGVGFITDYFGEVLARLREEDFQRAVRELPFAAGMTQRDQVAVGG